LLTEISDFVIYGDGTSFKNQNYEARLLGMKVGGENVIRFLGVHQATSHTAQAQFDGFLGEFEELVRLLKESPLGEALDLDMTSIARKLSGMVSDHAADQKLMSTLFEDWKEAMDRRRRGEDAHGMESVAEQLHRAVEALDEAMTSVPDWSALPEAQKSALFKKSMEAMLLKMGQSKFDELSPEEQADIDLFLWHGCCMHKDLNATRGGDARMKAAWEKHQLLPRPIPLKNKWEKAAAATDAEASTSDSRKAPEEKYSCGGTKLTCLCGALFNHKDGSKGLHRVIDDWFVLNLGHSHVFPDTSNVRYGSHCLAAIELLVNRHLYLRFLSELFNAKTKVGFTSMEQNIFDALSDWSTLTELAVLALYAQLISIPYIAYVRSYTGNALDLGPFHHDVLAHIGKLIADPELILTAGAAPEHATLFGDDWDRSDVIYWIWANMESMPHLRILWVEFLEGSLDTLERFTSEFAPGSAIDKATPAQREAAFSQSTNDISESALGVAKQSMLDNPTLGSVGRNSQAMRPYNKTEAWVAKNFTPALHDFARTEARRIDASGAAAEARREHARAFQAKVEANRAKQEKARARVAATTARIAATVLEHDPEKLANHTVPKLKDMIDVWRLTDKLVPTKSSLKNKTALISELTAALERAKKDHVEAVVELAEVQAGVESEGEVDEEDGWDEAPDDEEMED
jgi:hypothetical protein